MPSVLRMSYSQLISPMVGNDELSSSLEPPDKATIKIIISNIIKTAPTLIPIISCFFLCSFSPLFNPVNSELNSFGDSPSSIL